MIDGVSVAEGIDLRVERGLGALRVEWLEPGRALLSRRNALFEASSVGAAPRRLGAFPAPAWKRAAAIARQGARALRFMYYNVVPLADGSIFLTFAKSAGIYRDGAVAPLRGMIRPCRVLRSGAALAAGDTVYFGEYLDNAERGVMRIYRYRAGDGAAEMAKVFDAGSIRHIHGIYADPFDGSLWCVSGDVGQECRVMRSADGFRTIDTIGGGDESWRTVSLQFAADAVFYATDAEFTQNFIVRIDRRTGERTNVAAVGGPVYYSCTAGGQIFFAVTAELCPSQPQPAAELWAVDAAGGNCSRIVTLQKDFYSVSYFMPGTIDFPRGPGDGQRLYFGATALAGDNRTFSVAIPVRLH